MKLFEVGLWNLELGTWNLEVEDGVNGLSQGGKTIGKKVSVSKRTTRKNDPLSCQGVKLRLNCLLRLHTQSFFSGITNCQVGTGQNVMPNFKPLTRFTHYKMASRCGLICNNSGGTKNHSSLEPFLWNQTSLLQKRGFYQEKVNLFRQTGIDRNQDSKDGSRRRSGGGKKW